MKLFAIFDSGLWLILVQLHSGAFVLKFSDCWCAFVQEADRSAIDFNDKRSFFPSYKEKLDGHPMVTVVDGDYGWGSSKTI